LKPTFILVVEHEKGTMTYVSDILHKGGFEIIQVSKSLDLMRALYVFQFDMIVMDSHFPCVQGEDARQKIREISDYPILVLGNASDSFESLEIGADAFMTKPPGRRELLARVRNMLRRYQSLNNRNILPGLEQDTDNDCPDPKNGNGEGYLSATEFRLAACLLTHKGRVIPYSQLVQEAWGGKEVTTDTIHYHMRNLRKKLNTFYSKSIDILNLRGVGYLLEDTEQSIQAVAKLNVLDN
jgi:DNA-binding response OmpR family regulator